MSKVATKFIKNLTAIVLLHSVLFAQDKAELRVVNITPSLKDNFLAVSATFNNLFSQRIIGTIQSGLPSIIQIDLKIQGINKKRIYQKRIVHRISYNVWDEKYAIAFSDSIFISSDFDTVKKMSGQLDKLPIIALSQLNPNENYSIRIRVGIIPISAKQAEKVTDWLLSPNQTEEDIAAENRSSGFELNISKLVSFFVSSQKKSSYTSDWYSSKKFSINKLMQ